MALVSVAMLALRLVNAPAVEHGDPFATRASLFSAPPSLVTKGSPGLRPLLALQRLDLVPPSHAGTPRGCALPMVLGAASQELASVKPLLLSLSHLSEAL